LFEELDLKIADATGEKKTAEYTLPTYPYPCRGGELTKSSCGGTTLKFCC